MITFLDEKDVEYGALATIKVTNAVNGERSLTGEIESGDYVLENIERGWRLRFDDEYYAVTYAKPVDEGTSTHVTFDAVHQFFWDFDKSSVHEQLNDGSHTFVTYLDFIFKDSGYTYTIDPLLKVYAFEKQSFGYKSRLNLFNDIITSSGVEFQVNGKVVRILEKTGTDLSTVVRKNFNMNELGIEKNISDFVTYQKGFGAWFDEDDHTKGRLTVEYTSPLASVYGKLEAEPLVDERYTQADSMTAALKENVDNSYSISITLDMEDLTRAGYKYTQPVAGDYIMAIDETLGFKEKIRIVSFTSEYDVTGQLVKHEVTCNDIGAIKKLSASYSITKEQAQNASDSVVKAVEMANKALVSADGKNTVYFGTEFPEDEPKGTLHKGDSLYLTVGDTTKMYYWTGADWEELPIVNDVEAFKEQIADELKDVPNREEFEATITEKLATSKVELETQIDTAKTQAESNAKAYADEINQATSEVAEQANTAANSLKSDLAKVKTDLTATTSTANAAKTSASEAKQQLTTIANNLDKAKADLNASIGDVQATVTNQAKTLQEQASQLTTQANAQTELTKRVSNVEETANGTKLTVSELNKTVAQNGKDITSVTNRTKTVETSLTSAKTSISELQTGMVNTQTNLTSISQRTKTIEDDLNGTKTTLTNLSQTVTADGKTITSLTSRTKTVEDNVDGLKTTMSSVQKDLTSTTARMKIVEDDLSGTKTTLSQVKTTADSTSKKTATLETGLDGVKADLTATTTTANTTKTNLANYQASNDKVVANLQSSLKTTNGNVSSLQTKIEAVPGQITSAVSAVEGKIPTSIDTVNLIKGTGSAFVMGYGITNTTWDETKKQSILDFSNPNVNRAIKGEILPQNGKFFDFKPTKGTTYTQSIMIDTDATFAPSGKIQCSWYTSKGHNEQKAYIKKVGENSYQVWSTYTWNSESTALRAFDLLYLHNVLLFRTTGTYLAFYKPKLTTGNLPSDWSAAPEDTQSDITKISSELTQTKDGMTLLATKTELSTAKSDLQSGITTATNKANAAQSTADNNVKTISTHTTQISALNTGLSAKVSQTDFNTLSGRVTTAENNITAKANELSSKITSVEGKIPTSVGGRNLIRNSTGNLGSKKYWEHSSASTVTVIKPDLEGADFGFNIKADLSKITSRTFFDNTSFPKEDISQKTYVISGYFKNNKTVATTIQFFIRGSSDGSSIAATITFNLPADGKWHYITATGKGNKTVTDFQNYPRLQLALSSGQNHDFDVCKIKAEYGNIPTDWTPAPEDYDSKLATAQSEIKQTTDAISASVSALDKSTVKSASLTINTDGIVMKAGKSTTDVANAIGSYFAVNQNAINLFSDKINVKANMIVDGAITSTKIASKSITTAHLNGKIITADVISSNAVTADAIKTGAVTTDKMTANSINGDRITAGTLDAAKIKAGSITASQIASGTITSSQIKAGGISAANIAAGAITGDNIKANSVDVSKISGLSAEYLKAKIENAMIDWMKGKTITAYNGNMDIDLQNGRISFKDGSNAVYRQTNDGIHTGFLHFEAGSQGGIYAAFGATSTRQGINSKSSEFAGIRCYRVSANGDSHDAKIDKIEVIGDVIQFGHGYRSDGQIGGGFIMDTAAYGNNTPYSLNRIIKSIESLWRILHDHAANTGYRFNDSAFIGALNNEYNIWHDMHNI